MLTLRYDDGGVQRSIDLAIDSLRDVKPIMLRFLKYLRPEIDRVFQAQGPGWAPLAQSTEEARAAALPELKKKIREGAIEGLSRKLTKEQGRAETSLTKSVVAPIGSKVRNLLDRRVRTLERHKARRSAFEGIRSGRAEQAGKIGERFARAVARGEHKIERLEAGELLGAVANSIRADVTARGIEVYSTIPWAGIHNEGGTAGHGAKIPARAFLEWTPVRLEKLAEIAAEFVREKLTK